MGGEHPYRSISAVKLEVEELYEQCDRSSSPSITAIECPLPLELLFEFLHASSMDKQNRFDWLSCRPGMSQYSLTEEVAPDTPQPDTLCLLTPACWCVKLFSQGADDPRQ